MDPIHPTAVVHPAAKIHPSVLIGPYAVIGAEVELGPGCEVGPHVHLTGRVHAGSGNRFHAGCVIGDEPQDSRYKGEATVVRIGDNNRFREHVTVHRSNSLAEDTVIGSNNLLMAGSHVGHNTRLGNHVVLANGALLAGHVTVDDRAFISGNCLVHQFVRVGSVALMQGGSAISKDLPPFTIARGDNGICGLNIIGLRRAGVGSAERMELKKLYHRLFRSGQSIRSAVAGAGSEFPYAPSQAMIEFIRASKRGVCADKRRSRAAAESEE